MRHVGVATDEAELVRLKELGEFLKARIAHDRQPGLFPPEQVAEQVIEAGRRDAEAPDTAPLRVDLKALREERRIVTGIHEAYGVVYRELGFDRLLGSRYRASAPALFHTVMARIANPHSKRDTVRQLLKQLNKSGQPKSLVRRGAARFVRMKGQGRWELDPDKIAEDARWDGLYGVVTNLRGVSIAELFERYRGLWRVEESFRITKHDLKVGPIYHWTPRRVRTHPRDA